MANYESMTSYAPDSAHCETGKRGWYHTQTISAATTAGAWIAIPIGIDIITALVDITGEGKVQVTNDWIAVKEGTAPSVIIDWDEGSVTADAQSAIAPVAAVRAYNTSGVTTLNLAAY
jgi:hypothetical protein